MSQLDLSREHNSLGVPRRMVVVEIEARLTNGHHTALVEKFSDAV